jgi:hypothetical protein
VGDRRPVGGIRRLAGNAARRRTAAAPGPPGRAGRRHLGRGGHQHQGDGATPPRKALTTITRGGTARNRSVRHAAAAAIRRRRHLDGRRAHGDHASGAALPGHLERAAAEPAADRLGPAADHDTAAGHLEPAAGHELTAGHLEPAAGHELTAADIEKTALRAQARRGERF